MLDSVFTEVSLIVVMTFVVALVFKALKQPLVIAYIISGILASSYFFDLVQSRHAIEAFAEIGVAVLLFLVGIHLNPSIIKDVGKISLITGLGQVAFTSLIGFFIVYLLGFGFIESVYIGVALTFSSTIIIMKLLGDKGDLDTLYGKISMGFLIVQDLVAMIILMLISSGTGSGIISAPLHLTLLLGFVVICLYLAFGYYALPKIMPFVAKSSEFLLVFSVAWCLLAAGLFSLLGFSIEVGALLAGITLSVSPYRYEISSLLKSIRDFFILMFFIYLGSQMIFEGILGMIFPIILLSLFVLIGNAFIVLFLMTRFGYSSKVAFSSGLTVAQISEFSLILVALGVSVGDVSQEILSFVTIIGIITIASSTYMILYSNKLYSILKPILRFFEKQGAKYDEKTKDNYDITLIGVHRLGSRLLKTLESKGSVRLVDFDPQVISSLNRRGHFAIYGDVDDEDFVIDSGMLNVKAVISTVPHKDTSSLLLSLLKKHNNSCLKIVSAKSYEDALDLYSLGADYVIIPHFLAGQKSKELFEKFDLNPQKFRLESKRQVEVLLSRKRKEVDL